MNTIPYMPEDFERIEETSYLMRSPKNAACLLDSIAEIESLISQQQ